MGATLRLRPKLTTALVAVAGMISLAIGEQEGGEVLQPLAITVIGGIPASLVATLVVLPVLYVTCRRHRDERQFATGEREAL